MTTSNRQRTSPTLLPFLALPPAQSLTLLTSTLSCACNWLAARFVGSALQSEITPTAVVLISWIRDAFFWNDEIRRATGIDISRLPSSSPPFAFVDCLSDALLPPSDLLVAQTQKKIVQAIDRSGSSTRQVLLLLDTPTSLFSLAPQSTARELNRMLFTLRSHANVHSAILALPADTPFLSAATSQSSQPSTPLEIEHAAFTVQQAHLARMIMSCRELETGAARDVSGVLQITRGGGCYDEMDGEYDGVKKVDEVEELQCLYLVGRDGTVKTVE